MFRSRGSLNFLEVSMVPKRNLLKKYEPVVKRAKKVMKKAISAFNHRQKQVKNPNLQLHLK
jgi:hypothetical protein